MKHNNNNNKNKQHPTTNTPALPVSQILQRPRIGRQLRELGFAVEHFPDYHNTQPRLHRVDCVLLSFIVDGKGRHYLGENVYEETAGNLSITHYNEYHEIVTDEKGMDIINVYIDLNRHPLPRLPDQLRAVLGDLLPQHPVFCHRLNRMLRISFRQPQEPVVHLLKISDEMTKQPCGWRSAARLHFTLFLILCCREALESGMFPATSHNNTTTHLPASHGRLEKLRRKLDANFSQHHDLSELAREMKMTPQSLCRAFKRYTGLSISQYLVHRRIQEALIRLRATDDKILSIALRCGFNDLSYFNRTFKRLLGRTPGACRQ